MNIMKTILEIAPNFPGEVFINRHVVSLYQQKYPVEVLTRPTSRQNLESASVQEKFEFGFTPKVFPEFGHLSPADMLVIFKQLFSIKNFPYSKSMFRDQVYIEFIKRLNPDLIHFHFGNMAGAMCWIPRELGIPYTLSLRGSDIQVIPLISNENARQLQEALNHAAGIHTVSDSLWDLAKPYLKHEVFHRTIYTTVPIAESLSIKKSENGEVRFVTIGRLHWRKNYVDLLRAIRQLIDAGLQAKLVIIGDGSEKECLLYWSSILGMQNDVIFTGKLDHERILEIIASSAGYIQSSIAEGFSNATAEAMALGLPVFATDVGGTGEIIQDGVNGFLLDPFQPHEWYKKLMIIKNVHLMESIGSNAWQTAKEKFSEGIHANAFIDFYEHVLKDQIN
jgi:colanic acid/amylovoran biosynthesis glycosyltransferase